MAEATIVTAHMDSTTTVAQVCFESGNFGGCGKGSVP
jgi:hypothetical protein